MSEKINIVLQWIEKADHDLGTAQVTHIYLPQYNDTIAFHCQQAAEKYLKGLLVFYDIYFKRQHSLVYLLGLISKKTEIADVIYDKASELEDFAVEIRYPDTIIKLSDEDIEIALSIAKYFRSYVLSKMNIEKHYDDVKRINE